MRFKTNKIHKIKVVDYKPHYACNRAIGKLCIEQLRYKTNLKGRKLTCKNCLRYHKFKR